MKSPTVFFFILLLVATACCQPASDVILFDAADKATLAQFQALPPACQVQPAPDGEPGTPLLICGTLVRKENQAPVPHASVLVYHTDSRGDYRQSVQNQPETARISGTVQTDERGRFLLTTILPGQYNNQGPGGHIHLLVEGADPRGYVFQFTPYSSPTDKQFINDNDQFFLVDLKQDEKGRLVGFLEVAAKGL